MKKRTSGEQKQALYRRVAVYFNRLCSLKPAEMKMLLTRIPWPILLVALDPASVSDEMFTAVFAALTGDGAQKLKDDLEGFRVSRTLTGEQVSAAQIWVAQEAGRVPGLLRLLKSLPTPQGPGVVVTTAGSNTVELDPT